MSGVEVVVGLVLGVLPLLVSAAEYYENVYRPFSRYRGYEPELKEFHNLLYTQKTVFRTECQLLLESLAGRDLAKQMLDDVHHQAWRDHNLDQKFCRQLGESCYALKVNITMIRDKLDVIEKDSQRFGLLTESKLSGSFGITSWRLRVTKKLKFCFSEAQLKNRLDELRTLNHDFLTLAAQILKLKEVQHETVSEPTSKQKMDECQIVRRASIQLYAALNNACVTHAEHSAHFALEPQHVTFPDSEIPLIRFNMAFTYSLTEGSSASLDPLWFDIDTVSSKPMTKSQTQSAEILQQTSTITLDNISALKLELESPTDREQSKFPFQNRINDLASRVPYTAIPCTATAESVHSCTDVLPDFCVQHDFCTHFEKWKLRSLNQEESRHRFIGYLQKTGPFRHLVSLAPSSMSSGQKQSFSLAQLVGFTSSGGSTKQLMSYEKIRLAKKLASAVLQFHSTPLMNGSWRSEDVIFFVTNETSSVPRRFPTSPHLNVRVGGDKKDNGNLTGSPLMDEHFIRNSYLYSLAICLIELAYHAPLSSFQSKEDLENGQNNRLADFMTAARVSKTMSTELGVSYKRMVQKCLECDFGQGKDLDDPALQAAFYRDVVCELERLEIGFSQLQLGD